MTDTTTNPRLFSRDPAERRAFREELGAGIGRFIPPELRSRFQFLAEMTPSAAVERAGSAARSAVQPGLTAGERIGNVGAMLSETAGVAAPFAVATRAAMPAAEAAQEAFLGFSVPARAAAETAFERLNQPGPMPETLYSNPRFEEMIAALGRGARADRERVPREAREANDAIRADIGLPPLNPVPRPADQVTFQSSARGAAVRPQVGEPFDDWIDRIYAPENRGPGNQVQDPNVVFRAMSPEEASFGETEGVFRDVSGAPLYVANDPERYVGGGAYGGRNRGRIYEFDVTDIPGETRAGGVGITERAVSEIPAERVRRVWEWDPDRRAHVLIEDRTGAPRPENFAQGGAVMMRSNMPEQIHQGVGSLSEVARRMFGGGPVQYMQAGGEAITLNASNMVSPQFNAGGLALSMQEAQHPAFRTKYEDDFFVNSPLGYAAYEDGTPFPGEAGKWAQPAAPMEEMLRSVRGETGAPERSVGSGDPQNVQDLIQIFDFLQRKPASELTEQERLLLEEIPQYLSMRTGM